MNWQTIIVISLVILSAVWLVLRFVKTIKKPQSACDTCLMKDHCPADCEELFKKDSSEQEND